MKYLIFSDIHSNLEAFEAVLNEAEAQGVENYVFLGDAVGYYTNPNEVLEHLKLLPSLVIVRGNHDKVVAGLDDGADFNYIALKSALWNQEQISESNRRYLLSFPSGPIFVNDTLADLTFMICHGSPYDEDRYIFQESEAEEILRDSSLNSRLSFFGHTHFAVIYAFDGRRLYEILPDGDMCLLKLSPNLRYLINPGSVGQPRDANPKLSFAIFDSEAMTLSIQRCEYNIEAVQKKVIEARLPERLAIRLTLGR